MTREAMERAAHVGARLVDLGWRWSVGHGAIVKLGEEMIAFGGVRDRLATGTVTEVVNGRPIKAVLDGRIRDVHQLTVVPSPLDDGWLGHLVAQVRRGELPESALWSVDAVIVDDLRRWLSR